jgi:hypothetical protein
LPVPLFGVLALRILVGAHSLVVGVQSRRQLLVVLVGELEARPLARAALALRMGGWE